MLSYGYPQQKKKKRFYVDEKTIRIVLDNIGDYSLLPLGPLNWSWLYWDWSERVFELCLWVIFIVYSVRILLFMWVVYILMTISFESLGNTLKILSQGLLFSNYGCQERHLSTVCVLDTSFSLRMVKSR